MWLTWQAALVLAMATFVVGRLWQNAARARLRSASAMTVETSIVLGLYSLWQWAGGLSVTKVNGAERRGRRIVEIQHALHLPSEVRLQKLFLPHPVWVEFCNGYYAIMHVPAIAAFLIWAFLRDRDRYARWRTTLAITTGACLAVQLLPVAPPRMLPDLGYVDTALLYRQSVYSALGRGMAGQLAAMPSVHVAWAVLVGIGMWQLSTSGWRWLGAVHAFVTIVVVSATANHYWADGIVAVLILAIAALIITLAGRIFPSRPTALTVRPNVTSERTSA